MSDSDKALRKAIRKRALKSTRLTESQIVEVFKQIAESRDLVLVNHAGDPMKSPEVSYIPFRDKHELTQRLAASEARVRKLESVAQDLWQLLDDVSTADDMAKSNEALYRSLTRHIVEKRSKYYTSDGYTLTPVQALADSQHSTSSSQHLTSSSQQTEGDSGDE